jgi:hypothetical protein
VILSPIPSISLSTPSAKVIQDLLDRIEQLEEKLIPHTISAPLNLENNYPPSETAASWVNIHFGESSPKRSCNQQISSTSIPHTSSIYNLIIDDVEIVPTCADLTKKDVEQVINDSEFKVLYIFEPVENDSILIDTGFK